MDGKNRNNIKIGALVDIVLKKDQRSGKLTRGHVKRILTNSSNHPHGIKVMLEEDDMVGRVKNILKLFWIFKYDIIVLLYQKISTYKFKKSILK